MAERVVSPIESPVARPTAFPARPPVRILTPAMADARDRHARMPMVDALRAYQELDTAAFSTPGHKGGRGVDPELRDLLGAGAFAADIWLNTADHDAALSDAERLTADAWGADRAFFLVNGSSSGNHAFLLACLSPGDEVIVGRDVHTSLMTALVLTGACPVWVAPRLHPNLDIGVGVHPDDIADALDAHPNAKLVVLVSPTYWGIATDLRSVVGVAHRRGIPVYVDEAWGPHLPFHPRLPLGAMAAGADGATTSPHKLLAGLSQAALLLVRSGHVDPQRIGSTVRMGQSTSPLLPILASLDGCRHQMVRTGYDLLDRALALADEARDRIGRLPGLAVVGNEALSLPARRVDATRLVIDVRGLGLSGFAVERSLRTRFGIAPEMSDLVGIVCLVTIGDTAASVDRLVEALTVITREQPAKRSRVAAPRSAGIMAAPNEQTLTPREAFFAPARPVTLGQSIGEIAAEMLVPYPPGIPVLAPGERITTEKAEYLRAVAAAGASIRGAADPSIATIRIVSHTR